MQELQLFKKEEKIKINRWNIFLKIESFEENNYIANLELPSWKFIVKYHLIDTKIESFEIIDYAWYIYLSVNMIKNIKNLLQAIIK